MGRPTLTPVFCVPSLFSAYMSAAPEPARKNTRYSMSFPLMTPRCLRVYARKRCAVRKCLRIAHTRFGRDQKTIALMCGWKSDSCLSEIRSESNKRAIPRMKLHRFALATGCNLVSQYRERLESEARAKGQMIHRDESSRAAMACLSAWGIEGMREAA